jgi:hypothetical protein
VARETNCGGDLHAVDLFDVFFDLARAPAAGIERSDLFAEVAERGLALGNELRFKGGMAIAGRVDFDLAEIAAHGFGSAAIARVAGAAAFRIVLGIAEVLFHFELQEGLDGLLDEALEEAFGIHCLGTAGGAELRQQQLFEAVGFQDGLRGLTGGLFLYIVHGVLPSSKRGFPVDFTRCL